MTNPFKIKVNVSSRINKKQEDVSGRIIMWDYHSEAITEVLGGNIKWRYHLKVKVEV